MIPLFFFRYNGFKHPLVISIKHDKYVHFHPRGQIKSCFQVLPFILVGQGDKRTWPTNIGGGSYIDNIYSFFPIPAKEKPPAT